METRIIAKVNDVEIKVCNDPNMMVPIKPICEALGIDRKRQQDKIKEHPIYSRFGGLTPLTGADGKTYQMVCLPMEYIFGWLLSINPANVSEFARDKLISYQIECNHALFAYFTSKASFLEQKQKEIDNQLSIVEDAKNNFKNAKQTLAEAESRLKKLRSLTMEDYDIELRQLKLDFGE